MMISNALLLQLLYYYKSCSVVAVATVTFNDDYNKGEDGMRWQKKGKISK